MAAENKSVLFFIILWLLDPTDPVHHFSQPSLAIAEGSFFQDSSLFLSDGFFFSSTHFGDKSMKGSREEEEEEGISKDCCERAFLTYCSLRGPLSPLREVLIHRHITVLKLLS